jgi:hypothetical protein
MSRNSIRVALAEEIAKSWNEASIPYAIVHGVEYIPEKIGRDIDLVMRKANINEAVKCAVGVGLKHGFSRGFYRWSYWGLYQLVLLHDDNEISLPIDFICTTINWDAKWISFIDEDQMDRFISSDSRKGHFLVSNEGAFYKSCIKPLLCGSLDKFGKEISVPVEIPKLINQKHLKHTLGAFGIGLLKSANTNELKKAFPMAVRKLQWQWVRSHPLKAIVNLMVTLQRRVKLNLFNSSQIILIRTADPNALTHCLQELIQPLKQLFIELKPITANYDSISMILGSLIGWRHRPVSEFIFYTVVENIPKNKEEASSKVELRSGRGRIGLGPDAIITVPSGINEEDLYAQLREKVIGLVKALYPLPNDSLALIEGGEKK